MIEEVGDVVQFEAMNLVDNLLLQDSPNKLTSFKTIKKQKRVTFKEEPTVIEYETYLRKPRDTHSSRHAKSVS